MILSYKMWGRAMLNWSKQASLHFMYYTPYNMLFDFKLHQNLRLEFDLLERGFVFF